MSIELLERNNKIVWLRHAGYSFIKIAKIYNITRQRVTEIYNRYSKEIKENDKKSITKSGRVSKRISSN